MMVEEATVSYTWSVVVASLGGILIGWHLARLRRQRGS